jgi:signal transduction histidine kinase
MLVRSLTELHGGTVSIESAPDAGTTAEIRLPGSALVETGAGV